MSDDDTPEWARLDASSMTPSTTTTGVLRRYLRPEGRRIAALAAFMLLGIATQLVAPLIVRRFIDTAATGQARAPLSYLLLLAGAFIVAAIIVL